MKVQLTPSIGYHRTNPRSSLRIATFVIIVALIGIPLFSSSSASSALKRLGVGTRSTPTSAVVSGRSLPREESRITDQLFKTTLPFFSSFPMLLPQGGETITTFEYPGCSVPKNSFDLGETVCAVFSGAPLGADGRAARRISWVSPYGSVTQGAEIVSDPQTGTYAVPVTATQTFTDAGGGNVTVDNRGKWRIYITSAADNSLISETSFTVQDPAKAFVDLAILQTVSTAGSEVTAGSSGVFEIYVNNIGPSAATNVVITDTIPANTTFTSAIEEAGGPGFVCGTPSAGVFTCTLASLPVDTVAHISFNYSVDSGTAAGTVLENVATITSSATPCSPDTTCELVADDNTSTGTAVVPAETGSPTCSLDCPNNITVIANTSENMIAGAFVTYSAAQPLGTCGTVINSPASGSFFPVGSNTITSTSGSGDTCTFVVTVLPPETAPPTITCPSDKVVAAPSGSDEANVTVGTPTTNPSSGVTVTFVRSDEVPNCDPGPCPPKSLTDPYQVGVTFINWTVTDGTAQSASCTQRITVTSSDCGTDTQNPTITAPDDVTANTGAGSGSCGVALSPSDDSLGLPEASDNCSVTVTSNIPPGGFFPVGTTVVIYTATDGSGNTATDTQTVIVVDNTPPEIAAPADASYTCPSDVPAGHPSQATGTNPNLPNGGPVFDNCGTSTVTVTETSSGAGNTASPRIILRTFTATDTHGNSASAVQTITVIDPTPPTFTFVPGTVTAFTGPGATTCSTVVSDATLGTATATDNCSVTVTRSGVPEGNIFPKGDTTVTYTATDSGGNTAVATQTVTVIDDTPPVITCQAEIIADFDSAVNGAVVTYSAPVGTDNCPGASTTQIAGLASGSTFPLGTTTNTFRVTDASGHTAECSFKVTVAVTSILGLDSATLSGNALLDSYDSTGGYPATKGSLANLLSNGTVTDSGSSKMFGSVRSTRLGVSVLGTSQVNGNATAGTTVTKGASAIITGTITNNALAPVMTMPAVATCGPPYSSNSGITGTYSYNSSTGNLSISGINIATLANGNYCFNNVTLTNSGQLRVNGPVTIKLTGTFSAGGASTVNNTTQIPANLRILSSYSGSNGVTFGNSNSAYLLIYAPQTNVANSGLAPLFGTIVGKTVRISNSGQLHYDTKLKTIWPDLWTLILAP